MTNIPLGDEAVGRAGAPLRHVTALIWRAVMAPIEPFRANRRIDGETLLVNGRPAPWSEADRARFARHQHAIADAKTTLDAAHAAMVRPYRLAPEVLCLLGERIETVLTNVVGPACSMLAGAVIAGFAIWQARQPDATLLAVALRDQHSASPPSIADERNFLLGLTGIGIALLLWGGFGLARWWWQRRPAE